MMAIHDYYLITEVMFDQISILNHSYKTYYYCYIIYIVPSVCTVLYREHNLVWG